MGDVVLINTGDGVFTGARASQNTPKMATNVSDTSTYEMTWFISDSATGDVNYLYEGGEDYFFGSASKDVLIINADSSEYEISYMPGSPFVSVNPTSIFDGGSVIASELDAVEFKDKIVNIDPNGLSGIITFKDENGSSSWNDNVTLGDFPNATASNWHSYFYRGGDDEIVGTTERKEAIIINASSSEYEINETSAGITYVDPTGIFNSGGLTLRNIDAIFFNDANFALAPLDRDFPEPTPVAPAPAPTPEPTPVAPEKPQIEDEIITFNKIKGSRKKDRLNGTNGADQILGKGGNDIINGKNGDDLIDPGKWTTGKFDKIKGGKGSDTFVVKDGYWAFLKDFKVIEDKLDISGLSQGLDWEINGRKTYIYGDDGYEVARFKGKVDLSDANII